jgi:hypothetical protein
MLNSNYPSRDWLIAQYRGLLAAIALSENLGLSLQVRPVDLKDYQNIEFGRCLTKLKPQDTYNILGSVPSDGAWSQIFLFELEEIIIGFTSPGTLVVPVGYLNQEVDKSIPWVKNGFFLDPTNNGLTSNQKELMFFWLNKLRSELLKVSISSSGSVRPHPELSETISKELEKFYKDMGITELKTFEISEDIDFAELSSFEPLNALNPVKAESKPSNVKVVYSENCNPKQELYLLINPNRLTGSNKRDAKEINVIDSYSLAHFDPNSDLHRHRSDALFLSDEQLFTESLSYSRIKGLFPGTWLDSKLKVKDISILLPLNPLLKEYFGSKELEKCIKLSPCNTSSGEGVRVNLSITLSGFDNNKIQYSTYKDFPLEIENEIVQDIPALALWPNVPPGKWQEYFVFVEMTESLELAFHLDEPMDRAIVKSCQHGQDKYQYWICERYPEILPVINNEGKCLGLLPLNIPEFKVGANKGWTVGVDFGTCFTNVSLRKGTKLSNEKFKLESNLLQITSGIPGNMEIIFREYFIPDTFLPKDKNPPLLTALTTRGWQAKKQQTPELIHQARAYVPRLDSFDFNEDYIISEIKWKSEEIGYQSPLLKQLSRLIAAQAAQEGVESIEWGFTYPSAFSTGQQGNYEVTWEELLKELTEISGQNHQPLEQEALRTESVAFAQFFGDVLGQDLVHTTCVDIGGGTSDISIWQDNHLVHQASVPYAGRDLFHQILQPVLKPDVHFIDEIFGLSSDDAKVFCDRYSSPNNFNLSLDNYLRGNAETILSSGYRKNSDKQHNREFRTLVAFAFGGLYHYLGLVQKYLKEEESFKDTNYTGYVTSILVGGNGSQFLHWLTISGRYTPRSEVNLLLKGILTKASSLPVNEAGDLMTLSPQPKNEACGGLVVLPADKEKGEKLTGWQGTQPDRPFLGESCSINGQNFSPEKRIDIKGLEEITEFKVTSFDEIRQYLINFNQVIADEQIQEIEPLRNFGKGGLFEMNKDVQALLEKSVNQACLRKKGPATDFQPEPPFLMNLRCFVAILATQWSKTAN